MNNIYTNLGFDKNPFAYTNADEEENLEEYFISPPYYENIQGDYNSPSSNIVLAPRGSGKTAQRKMIEIWSKDKPVLCVTYDRFELGNNQSLDDITLNYHLKNIIQQTLIHLTIWLSEYPDTLNNFTKEDKKNLNVLCHNYLGEITASDVNNVVNNLKSVNEKIKKYWNEHIGFLDTLLNFILKKYDLPQLDLPQINQEEKKLSQSYKYQLEIIYQLATRLGFKSIYILIDKVDETHLTSNDPNSTFRLIEPLIKDLETHSLKGYAFKYFLWDKIYDKILASARPDRIQINSLVWSKEKLLQMLSQRLKAFSKNEIYSINQLYNNFFSEITADEMIIALSWRSPRNVIRICQEIIAEQSLINTRVVTLDVRTLDRASIKISEKISEEIYGNDTISDIKKFDKELFSISHLANNIFKISANAVRPKITNWSDKGFICNVGNDKSGEKKPVNIYYISDPRVNRLINNKKDLYEYFSESLKTCRNCDSEIIINDENINSDMSIECWNCKRNFK